MHLQVYSADTKMKEKEREYWMTSFKQNSKLMIMLLHIRWLYRQQFAYILAKCFCVLKSSFLFLAIFFSESLCFFFLSVMTLLCFGLQDGHWSWAGLDLQHGQVCWGLRCRSMLSLGWGRSRCSHAGSSCPEGLCSPQQLQVPLWFGGVASKLDCCS